MPNTNEGEIRIGVFICHCGSNIAGYLTMEALEEDAKTQPQPPITSSVHGTALVIGGGISGITSALSLAARGFEVALVEKTKKLGGLFNKLTPTNEDAETIIAGKVKEVEANPRITLFTESKVTAANGFIGKYNVDIQTQQGVTKLDIGVIVVAVGGKVFVPEGK